MSDRRQRWTTSWPTTGRRKQVLNVGWAVCDTQIQCPAKIDKRVWPSGSETHRERRGSGKAIRNTGNGTCPAEATRLGAAAETVCRRAGYPPTRKPIIRRRRRPSADGSASVTGLWPRPESRCRVGCRGLCAADRVSVPGWMMLERALVGAAACA